MRPGEQNEEQREKARQTRTVRRNQRQAEAATTVDAAAAKCPDMSDQRCCRGLGVVKQIAPGIGLGNAVSDGPDTNGVRINVRPRHV